MTVAFDHALDLFKQLAIADELIGYPSQLFVVPADAEKLSSQVLEQLDEGMTAIIVFEDASQRILIPSDSRLRRRIDRLRGRIRVQLESRTADGHSPARRVTSSRAAFERNLIPA